MNPVLDVVRRINKRSVLMATRPLSRNPERRAAWLEDWEEDVGELWAYLSEWDDPDVHELPAELAESLISSRFLVDLIKRELADIRDFSVEVPRYRPTPTPTATPSARGRVR